MESPIEIDKIDASIYHTTIPTYGILIISAVALVTVHFLRRKKTGYNVDKGKTESSTQAGLELQNLSRRSEDKRDAAFAVDLSK